MRNRGIATSVAVAVLVGVFGVPASASAESIVGVVVDPAGRALADCRVEAEGATGQGGYGMSNSSDAGAFQIDG